jgi:PAS domain S-box-containing protein
MNTTFYILGIILQALASIIALVEVRRAPVKLPWLLISLSSLLIVVRRASTLEQFIKSGRDLAAAEVLTLLISLLFFLGVILMSRMFSDFQKEHEALKQSEKRYMLALLGSRDGLYDWDLSNNKVLFSSGWKSMIGYADDEISNKLSEWERLVHPDEKKRVLDAVNNFISGKNKEYKVEMRMKHKDGHWVHVLSRGDIIRDRDKKPWRLIGTHVDITDRKIAEEAVKKLSQYTRSLLESSLDPLVTIDTSGVITDVNTASEKVTGVSRGNLIGSVFSVYFTDPVKANEGYRIAFENGMVRDYPLSIRHVDGHVTDVIYNASVYKNEDGSVAGVFAAARDITDRKKIEMELKSSRDMLESLWNVASVAEADIKTICDYILFEIVKMTSSRYGFYGFINDDESIMTIYSWSGDAMKDCSMVDKPVEYKISECGIWAEAIRLRKPLILNDYSAENAAKKGYPAGHVPLTRLLVVPVLFQGKIISVAAVANKVSEYGENDVKQITSFMANIKTVTDHKKAEDKIKTLLNEKELLLREVHHRIKNNMNTIIGILSLHADRLKNPETVEAINEAENRVRSMMILYDKIYRNTNFRELTASQYFPSLVDEIVKSFPNSNEVKVKIDMDEFELGVKVLFPLGIIVNELLTNIMKYAFKKGDTGLITVTARKNEHIEFIIEDNGIGIPENETLGNSTGFGLQLVGMLASDINAKIRIERKNGTKFIIEFDL